MALRRRRTIAKVPQRCGVSGAEASHLAKSCGGSLTILKRLLTDHPQSDFPLWSQDEFRSQLAPFALVGGWCHIDPDTKLDVPFLALSRPPVDLIIVEEITGLSREQIEATLVHWSDTPDPLFVKFLNSVFVASREDAWYLLARSLTPGQMKRFEDAAVLALDENNPAFELEVSERWKASLYGKKLSLSEDLRRSLVETLVLIATRPINAQFPAHVVPEVTVRHVVQRVLPLGATWQRWASLGRDLPLIAEADPEYLLNCVEYDLNTTASELPKLFQDHGDPVFSRCLHSGLLWALESLAWSSRYLPRVAVILARLERLDPGGKWANRPGSSFKDIFLYWYPNTTATVAQRIDALRRMLKEEPEFGWRLLSQLLPGPHNSHAHQTHQPEWRDWLADWSREAATLDDREYLTLIGELSIEAAGEDFDRWAEVTHGLIRIGEPIVSRVLAGLELLSVSNERRNNSFRLWDTLRTLTHEYRRIEREGRSIPSEVLSRLEQIEKRLAHQDPVLKYAWLFDHLPRLPGCDLTGNLELYHHALSQARLVALKEMLAEGGPASLFRLAEHAKDIGSAALLVGQHGLIGFEAIGLLSLLGAEEPSHRMIGYCFVHGRLDACGREFIDELPYTTWSARERALFATALPFERATWEWIQNCGPEAGSEYWRIVRGFVREPVTADVELAIDRLLQAGRPFRALEVLQMANFDKCKVPPLVAMNILEAGLKFDVDDQSDRMRLAYYVQETIKWLQRKPEAEPLRLARIEWGYLQVLEQSNTQPLTLLKALRTEPQFFVDLVMLLFPNKTGEKQDDQSSAVNRAMAENAYDLFRACRTLPGVRDDASVDEGALRSWVATVRQLLLEGGRLNEGDRQLGELFAHSPLDADESWPAAPIRRVMEEIGTEEFFSGFRMGVCNSRGIVWRSPGKGGGQERALAERYHQLVKRCQTDSPGVASALEDIARSYDFDAKREDEKAARERTGR